MREREGPKTSCSSDSDRCAAVSCSQLPLLPWSSRRGQAKRPFGGVVGEGKCLFFSHHEAWLKERLGSRAEGGGLRAEERPRLCPLLFAAVRNRPKAHTADGVTNQKH